MSEMGTMEQPVTFEQVIAFAQAAMDGADALDQTLAGNHIAAGLEMLRAAHQRAGDMPRP